MLRCGVQMIDVFIISLADADDRRQSASEQLAEAGIDFRFYDAIRGDAALTDGHLEACDEEDWVLHCGRSATAGELGCYASHRNLWKKCIELDRPILVMEDDFRLLDGFADAIGEIERNIDRLGFLRLQSETRARHVKVGASGDFELRRYTYAPHSMMCYAIAPRVAKSWVEQTRTVCEPVDVFVKQFWRHGQPIYALAPYTVTESTLSCDSCIRGRVKESKSIGTALKRFVTKTTWHLKRLRFNFSFSDTEASRTIRTGAVTETRSR